MGERDFIEKQKRIDRLLKSSDDAYVRAARAQGLSMSALDILYALLMYGEGVTQKDLCDFSYTGKQTVNSSIHKMEREGLLRLEPGEGRRTLVYLTAAGRELAERTVRPILEAERAALESVPAKEAERAFRVAVRYTESLVAQLDAVAEDGAAHAKDRSAREAERAGAGKARA